MPVNVENAGSSKAYAPYKVKCLIDSEDREYYLDLVSIGKIKLQDETSFEVYSTCQKVKSLLQQYDIQKAAIF